ncbi:hypothetical protein [Hyphomonas adhaerens]|uniref:hypothetical protein n=1 Tax=Hyphomonas adhaerens TaxID=81029 RepID=UPI002354D0AF|nr:hypothetical protein [Hyphomonas adhaerens]|tara:strand:- start:265 stop:687 length:423 start_codon:yes stop_codon:yes gene_type:complete
MAFFVQNTNMGSPKEEDSPAPPPGRAHIRPCPNVIFGLAHPVLAQIIGTCSSFLQKGENNMPTSQLTRVRKSILPAAGDTWQSIAKRELSGMNEDEGVSSLQSWNLHVFMRSSGAAGGPKSGNPILPSDVIFVEPPMSDA